MQQETPAAKAEEVNEAVVGAVAAWKQHMCGAPVGQQ